MQIWQLWQLWQRFCSAHQQQLANETPKRSFYLLSFLFLFACQSTSSAKPTAISMRDLSQSCRQSFAGQVPPSGINDFADWKQSKELSPAEQQAIQKLRFISEAVLPQRFLQQQNEASPNRHSDLVASNKQNSQFVAAELRSGGYRSIVPVRQIDGRRLFVLAQNEAPQSESVFIVNFVLLVEGKNGWQSRFLFSETGAEPRHDYLGSYDISMSSSDFDYDGSQELVFASHTGGNSAMIRTEILRIAELPNRAQLQIEKIQTPSLHKAQSAFEDDFLLRIQLQEEAAPLLIRRPIARQKELGYDQQTGQWLGEAQEPWLYSEATAIRAVELDCNKNRYPLLYSSQPLKGLANFDGVGYFHSLWRLQKNIENGNFAFQWQLVANRFEAKTGNEVLSPFQQ